MLSKHSRKMLSVFRFREYNPDTPFAFSMSEILSSHVSESVRSPLPPLKIGRIEVPHPIIQGGMGVGVSHSGLAGAVARSGAVGTLSSVGLSKIPLYKGDLNERIKSEKARLGRKLTDSEYEEAFQAVNIESIAKEVARAREISGGNGAVFMNVMVAVNRYREHIVAACEAGVDAVVCGAGLPTDMPEIAKDYPHVALIPIVSSPRAANILLKKWARFGRLPDAFVVEDPSRAGGHLGSPTLEKVDAEDTRLESAIPELVRYLKEQGLEIPVIAAGGIATRANIDWALSLGASGVQMGTRFLATEESGASLAFKDAVVRAAPEDVVEYYSNAMLPARALRESEVFEGLADVEVRVRKCVENCLTHCAYRDGKGPGYAQMCILKELTRSVEKPRGNGLFFVGETAARIDRILSVDEVMDSLTK